MRTTLTIDEDVAALLREEMQRTGESQKQAVNRLLRSALQQSSEPKLKPFRVKTRAIGLPLNGHPAASRN